MTPTEFYKRLKDTRKHFTWQVTGNSWIRGTSKNHESVRKHCPITAVASMVFSGSGSGNWQINRAIEELKLSEAFSESVIDAADNNYEGDSASTIDMCFGTNARRTRAKILKALGI